MKNSFNINIHNVKKMTKTEKYMKYPEISNSTQQKFLDAWLFHHPELEHEIYIIQEKVDGSNIQLTFLPDGTYFVGKRNHRLKEDENFSDIWNTLKDLEGFIEEMKLQSKEDGKKLTFYGEIFGPKILGRVNYGDKKRILFFDMMIDDVLQPPCDLESLLFLTGFQRYRVPTLDMVTGLQNALEYKDTFESKLSPTNDIAEGIVIKPYNRVYTYKVEGRKMDWFVLKKKNEKFKENKSNRTGKVKVNKYLNHPFVKYINENRVMGVYSKEGVIENKEDIPKYIRFIFEDAKSDFLKDGNDLSIEDEKGLYPLTGKLVVKPFLFKQF